MEIFGFHECSHKLHDNKLKDTLDGAIAQLGERLPCTQEVSSSILLSSTILNLSLKKEAKFKYTLLVILNLVF